MDIQKRGPGRPKKNNTGPDLPEKDTKKKVKLEDDEALYHPQFNGKDYDDQLADDMSESGPSNGQGMF